MRDPQVRTPIIGFRTEPCVMASRTSWAGTGRDNQQAGKSRIVPAISRAWVSSAKCPVIKKAHDRTWIVAFEHLGTHREKERIVLGLGQPNAPIQSAMARPISSGESS
jgi:hypothetical protein